jgi:hypothetical protein
MLAGAGVGVEVPSVLKHLFLENKIIFIERKGSLSMATSIFNRVNTTQDKLR